MQSRSVYPSVTALAAAIVISPAVWEHGTKAVSSRRTARTTTIRSAGRSRIAWRNGSDITEQALELRREPVSRLHLKPVHAGILSGPHAAPEKFILVCRFRSDLSFGNLQIGSDPLALLIFILAFDRQGCQDVTYNAERIAVGRKSGSSDALGCAISPWRMQVDPR